MNALSHFDASDLKVIYRSLHRSLMETPDLMESDFLMELQIWLRTLAASEGVDTSDHGQWDRWLGATDAPSCEERMARRTPLSVV